MLYAVVLLFCWDDVVLYSDKSCPVLCSNDTLPSEGPHIWHLISCCLPFADHHAHAAVAAQILKREC